MNTENRDESKDIAADRRESRSCAARRNRALVRRSAAIICLSLFAIPFGGLMAARVSASGPVTSNFIWTVSASNIDSGASNATIINNGATNGKPSAVLFVTPVYDSGGVCGCVRDMAPVGVWYSAGKWEIFREDHSNMAVGESFNVMVVPKVGGAVFTHTATTISLNSSYINSPLTNGKPSAPIQVTQAFNPGGSSTAGVYNDHPVGMFYDTKKKKWAIFNGDGSAVPTKANFDVMVGTSRSGGGTSALIKTTTGNQNGDDVHYSNTNTDGNPNAVVFETLNWNPNTRKGTYDGSPTGVFYSTNSSVQGVFDEDLSAMPLKASFNLLIFPS